MGAAAGASGCTNEHLRVFLDEEVCTEMLGRAADRLAGAVDLSLGLAVYLALFNEHEVLSCYMNPQN